MATCIQVVNPAVLVKIESFFSDPTYRETIENSANYNTRLCIERRLRMPFLDSQTGVAQNHSNLFMTSRQRIPGLVEGQIYTYPSKRWKKKRRQYLMNFMQPRRKELDPEGDMHTISTVENPAACNEDSKDSVGLKDEAAKFGVMQDAWYYDEIDMQEMEGFDDPDPDSDYDYEESYTKRKKKPKKVTRNSDSPAAKKPKGPGRGRKKSNYDGLTDAEKPFACELCGARYKTRPGLTYHYTHSHKDRDDEDSTSGAGADGVDRGTVSPSTKQPALTAPVQQLVTPHAQAASTTQVASVADGAGAGWSKFQDSYLTFLKTPGTLTRSPIASLNRPAALCAPPGVMQRLALPSCVSCAKEAQHAVSRPRLVNIQSDFQGNCTAFKRDDIITSKNVRELVLLGGSHIGCGWNFGMLWYQEVADVIKLQRAFVCIVVFIFI